MQFGLLIVLGAALGLMMRRITLLRRQGLMPIARRLYLRTAWAMIAAVWGSMLTQELILLLDGRLTWQTGLPLHLCSAMGVLLAPVEYIVPPFVSRRSRLYQREKLPVPLGAWQ